MPDELEDLLEDLERLLDKYKLDRKPIRKSRKVSTYEFTCLCGKVHRVDMTSGGTTEYICPDCLRLCVVGEVK